MITIPFQTASAVMLVRNTKAGYPYEHEREYDGLNHWGKRQANSHKAPELLSQKLTANIDNAIRALKQHDVDVRVFNTNHVGAPYKHFPNSRSTFHGSQLAHAHSRLGPIDPNGLYVIAFPMYAPVRQIEATPAFSKSFERMGYTYLDNVFEHPVSFYQNQDSHQRKALEATGALVHHHAKRVVYPFKSLRCDLNLAEQYAAAIGYEMRPIETIEVNGDSAHHGDIVLSISENDAAICPDVIDYKYRTNLLKQLKEDGLDIISYSMDQFNPPGKTQSFIINQRPMRNLQGQRIRFMSDKAYELHTPYQVDQIRSNGSIIVHADLTDVCETGLGDACCTVQELMGLNWDLI